MVGDFYFNAIYFMSPSGGGVRRTGEGVRSPDKYWEEDGLFFASPLIPLQRGTV